MKNILIPIITSVAGLTTGIIVTNVINKKRIKTCYEKLSCGELDIVYHETQEEPDMLLKIHNEESLLRMKKEGYAIFKIYMAKSGKNDA